MTAYFFHETNVNFWNSVLSGNLYHGDNKEKVNKDKIKRGGKSKIERVDGDKLEGMVIVTVYITIINSVQITIFAPLQTPSP